MRCILELTSYIYIQYSELPKITVISTLMCIAIFSSISHPRSVINVLMIVFDMLPGMELIVMTAPAIILAFIAGVANAVDVLVDLPADALIVLTNGVVPSAIDAVGILADENVNRLAITLPAPREDVLSVCAAAFA